MSNVPVYLPKAYEDFARQQPEGVSKYIQRLIQIDMDRPRQRGLDEIYAPREDDQIKEFAQKFISLDPAIRNPFTNKVCKELGYEMKVYPMGLASFEPEQWKNLLARAVVEGVIE